MSKLPKYTLEHDEKGDKWLLENDATNKAIKSFGTKADATERGALKRAVGPEGGSVKIQKMNGRYQEERTYPRSRDPRKSKG